MPKHLSPPKSHNVSHATFLQGVVVVFLAVVNGIYTGLSSCLGQNKTDCSSNSFTIPILIVLALAWFGFLAAMAYVAWVRRTLALIVLFIVLELITVGVSAFGISHHDNLLGFITSLIDFLVGLWVLVMCYFLFQLRGTSSEPKVGLRRSKLNQPASSRNKLQKDS